MPQGNTRASARRGISTGSRLPRRDHRAWVIFEIHANLSVSPYKRKSDCELRPAFETAFVTLEAFVIATIIYSRVPASKARLEDQKAKHLSTDHCRLPRAGCLSSSKPSLRHESAHRGRKFGPAQKRLMCSVRYGLIQPSQVARCTEPESEPDVGKLTKPLWEAQRRRLSATRERIRISS